eukprot:g24214.t1
MKWQMEYNVGKCEIMHFGQKNRGIDYFLNGEKIQKSEVQRDLGILGEDPVKSGYFSSMFSGSWKESNMSYIELEIPDQNIDTE